MPYLLYVRWKADISLTNEHATNKLNNGRENRHLGRISVIKQS